MPERSPLADVECEDLVDELTSRMDMSEEEAAKFKNRCMLRSGFHAEPKYVKADGKDDKDSFNKTYGGSKSDNDKSRSRKSEDDEWYKG
jgi:hypothetical protein